MLDLICTVLGELHVQFMSDMPEWLAAGFCKLLQAFAAFARATSRSC